MTELAPIIEFKEQTILVIDDISANLQVAADHLTAAGFKVLAARNGERGLARAQRSLPDLILLDVLMPGINGFETCRLLKANPITQDIPIIFMTSLSETENKVTGFEVGAVDYVTKPFQREELLARVKTHLRLSHLTHHLESLVLKRTEALTQSLQREQLLSQELTAALALRSEIIKVVSHEFRTPLTVISQSTDLLQNYYERLSYEQKDKQFIRMREAINFISDLLRDVLFVDKDGVVETVIWQTLSLAEFGSQVETTIRTDFGEAERIRFLYDKVNTLPITTDVGVMNQIISVLVSNALKFSEAEVTLYLYGRHSWVVLEVSDLGIGVPEAEWGNIFALFGRGSNVDARRGLGLGLYIAEQLAESVGAELTLKSSSLNKGTTFCLEFPSKPVEAEQDFFPEALEIR